MPPISDRASKFDRASKRVLTCQRLLRAGGERRVEAETRRAGERAQGLFRDRARPFKTPRRGGEARVERARSLPRAAAATGGRSGFLLKLERLP